MTWNMQDYPSSMKNLETPIKKKAIDISNRLLEEGYDEGRAISIGIAQAEKWVEAAPPPQHLVPHPDGWAIKAEHGDKASFVFENKADALTKAKEIAHNQETQLIIHKEDGEIEQQLNFG